ncbi:CoA transferase subunit A [Nonomuraea typhae]|uniref:CoA transferase subunit A n=1 Tax=Nonomuraea typhae TaxID=2603600 RepID=UPI001CA477A3|nr:CoA-transferase [Nonomuraea typhae]
MRKLLTAAEAVSRFVRPGAVVGMGGQNINRCPMALVHEVIRQEIGGLTVVGCNLSLPLDMLVAAGLVTRTEQGTGNLERYGTLFAWRRAVERGEVSVGDHSHLAMATRFAAGALGLPYLPTRSLLGTSLLADLVRDGVAVESADPFGGGPVVLLKAMTPDVALIHANRADVSGNIVIEGVTSHEVDMVRAARFTVVSAEQVLPAGAFADRPEQVTIPEAYVTAVVEQPFGAFPTSVYRAYDFAEPEIKDYQALGRTGDEEVRSWIAASLGAGFDDYLEHRDPSGALRDGLVEQMRRLV